MGYVPHRERPAEYRESKKRQNRVRRWKQRAAPCRDDAQVSDEELDRHAAALALAEPGRPEAETLCPLCRRPLRRASNGALRHWPGQGKACDLEYERRWRAANDA
jgi:hypothetical protein